MQILFVLNLHHDLLVECLRSDRLGRLLAAVAYNPFLIGIGIDEDTAIFIKHDHTFEVVGSGAVYNA